MTVEKRIDQLRAGLDAAGHDEAEVDKAILAYLVARNDLVSAALRVNSDAIVLRQAAAMGVALDKHTRPRPTASLEPLLSVREAAQILGVSARTVWRLIDRGELLPTRIGSRVLLDPDALRRLRGENGATP